MVYGIHILVKIWANLYAFIAWKLPFPTLPPPLLWPSHPLLVPLCNAAFLTYIGSSSFTRLSSGAPFVGYISKLNKWSHYLLFVNALQLCICAEHMLFMGSSKFPDENEVSRKNHGQCSQPWLHTKCKLLVLIYLQYDSFLSKHGGSSNAFTDSEHTCYYFEVNHKFLKPALDR